MADDRVAAVAVRECGDALVDAARVVRVEDRRRLGDGRFARVRSGIARRLSGARAALPDGIDLLLIEGHRTAAEQHRLIERTTYEIRRAQPDLTSAELDAAVARYVAPVSVAGHVAGAAVDITLCDDTGRELDLGSAEAAGELESDGRCWFDAEVPEPARRMRELLASVLSEQGFVNYAPEWWHWSYGDRYWAALTGAEHAPYGPAPAQFDDEVDASTSARLAAARGRTSVQGPPMPSVARNRKRSPR